MKKVMILLLLICVLTSAAYAAVPQEINHTEQGDYRLIEKVYELAPGDDPTQLVEEPFDFMGYSYILYSLTKQEYIFEDSRPHTELVAIETATDEMADILHAIAPTIEYEQGGYHGVLALDHTTISTQVSGYSTRYYTVTDTQTLPGLDRNDPAYVPKASEKNGVSLALDSVQWSVDGYDADFNPISYTAYASYSSGYSSKVPNGYITTAIYKGAVETNRVSSVTYTVVFIGGKIPEEAPAENNSLSYILYAIAAVGLLLTAVEVAKVFPKNGKNVNVYRRIDGGTELEMICRRRLCTLKPVIDLRKLENCPEELVIEIEGKTAKKLNGKTVTVKVNEVERLHLIEHFESGEYWFMVNTVDEEAEE